MLHARRILLCALSAALALALSGPGTVGPGVAAAPLSSPPPSRSAAAYAYARAAQSLPGPARARAAELELAPRAPAKRAPQFKSPMRDALRHAVYGGGRPLTPHTEHPWQKPGPSPLREAHGPGPFYASSADAVGDLAALTSGGGADVADVAVHLVKRAPTLRASEVGAN